MVAVRDTGMWPVGCRKCWVVLTIKQGIGISEADQKRLFERFHQATPKTEQNYGGSGLGLNISRKICHLHGGEVGVSSIEGQGSTFGMSSLNTAYSKTHADSI